MKRAFCILACLVFFAALMPASTSLTTAVAGRPAPQRLTAAARQAKILRYAVVQRGGSGSVRIGFNNDSANTLMTASNYAALSDLSNLGWIAARGGTGFNFAKIQKNSGRFPAVRESAAVKRGKGRMWFDSKPGNGSWIRLYDTRPQSTNDTYRDVLVFLDTRQSKDAILGLQSCTDSKKWSFYRLPGYASWLKTEINLIVRVTAAL